MKHVVRCETEDPLYQVTFTRDGQFVGYDYQKVGRPRGHWAEATIAETLADFEGIDYQGDDQNQLLMTFVAAIDRIC